MSGRRSPSSSKSSSSSSSASSTLSVRDLSQDFGSMDIRHRPIPPKRAPPTPAPPTARVRAPASRAPPSRSPARKDIRRDRYGRVYEVPEITKGSKLILNTVAKMNPYEVSAPERLVPPPKEPYENGVDTPSTSAPNNCGGGKTQRSGPVEEFGRSYDDERLRHNSEIVNQLNSKDNKLTVATPTIGLALAGFSICSNCKNSARPPISCCSKGHIMCAFCAVHEQVTMCPRLVPACNTGGHGSGLVQVECGTGIYSCPLELYRHYFDTSVFYCPYKEDGCPEKYPGSGIDSHINNCGFRPSIVCPFSFCHVGMIQPRNFFEHLTHHGVNSYHTNTATVKVKHERRALIPSLCRDFRWIGAHFHAGKLDFLLLVQESKDDLYLWVQFYTKAHIIGTRTFISSLKLTVPGSPREMEWCGDVFRSEVDMDRIWKPDCCMVLPKAPFERHFMYRGDDDHSYFNVEVDIDQVLVDRSLSSTSESNRARVAALKPPSYRL